MSKKIRGSKAENILSCPEIFSQAVVTITMQVGYCRAAEWWWKHFVWRLEICPSLHASVFWSVRSVASQKMMKSTEYFVFWAHPWQRERDRDYSFEGFNQLKCLSCPITCGYFELFGVFFTTSTINMIAISTTRTIMHLIGKAFFWCFSAFSSSFIPSVALPTALSILKSIRSRIVPWSITSTASSLKMPASSSIDCAIFFISTPRSLTP